MLRPEHLADIDELNKQIRDFLALFDWTRQQEALDESRTLVARYTPLATLLRESLDVIAAEMARADELPSESNRDMQDVEILLISLKSLVTEERGTVIDGRLREELATIHATVLALNPDAYAEATAQALARLAADLKSFPAA